MIEQIPSFELYINVMCLSCQEKFHVHSESKGGINFLNRINSFFSSFFSLIGIPFPISIDS